MLKIDNSLLEEIGLAGLPEGEKNSFLKHIYETLEMRVGIRLADQMTDEQLDEFERYFEAKDDAGAFKWLETNFPNYKDIVQQEFDKLKGEVAQTAPQILGASHAAHVQPAATPVPDQPIYPTQSQPGVPGQPTAPVPQPQPQFVPPAYPTPPPPPGQPIPQPPPPPRYADPSTPPPQSPAPNQPLPPYPTQQPPAGFPPSQ